MTVPADDPGAAGGPTRATCRLPERELLERGASRARCSTVAAVRAGRRSRLAESWSPRLGGLVRKELIRPHGPTFEGDEAFRFRHLLIRDAAYDALPKATRANCTSGFADWLEQNAPRISPSSTRSPAGTSNKPTTTNANSTDGSTR